MEKESESVQQAPENQSSAEKPVSEGPSPAKKQARHNLLVRLLRNKRQSEADALLENLSDQNEEILNGFKHNKFGAFCLQAGNIKMAEEHFQKAKQILTPHFQPFTNLYMNLGNIEAQKKNYQGAIGNYEIVMKESPHANPKSFAGNEVLFSKHVNSFNAYVDAHTNAAVMYVQLDQIQRGFDLCEKSLELKPDDSESAVNFTDFLRQLGKKEEAIRHSWNQIIEYTQKHGRPQYEGFKAVEINSWKPQENHQIPEQERHISVLTVKWGARYDADYVNKLYAGILKYTTWKITFYCFTDDGNGLHPDIKVERLEEGWKRWWGKVTLFNFSIPGRKFYIDLDMIITGSLDELFSYDGQFATLRTGDLACQKNHKDGYNSSVMIWKGDHLKPVYEALKDNFDSVTKFIVRFDFWLEMTINNADYLQILYPRRVIDFLADAKEELPEGSSIVCFARKPKPEDYPAPWVKEYWVNWLL